MSKVKMRCLILTAMLLVGMSLIAVPKATAAFAVGSISVLEGNAGEVQHQVRVNGPFASSQRVEWWTSDGTATAADNDYLPVPRGSATIQAPLGGAEAMFVWVTIYGDTKPEPDEYFYVHVAGGQSGTVTILNDDGPVLPPPTDTTPPDITALLSPATPDGSNGWYRGNVTLTWVVTDPESPITNRTGCDTVNVTADQVETTYLCTATSEGGTSTLSRSIKRDASPPTISAAIVNLDDRNTAGWFNGPVTIRFTCGDALSGVVSCPADVVLAEDGANQSVTRSVFDHAGNSATASVDGINIDRTNPTISAEVLSTPNTAGWFNGPVTIRFTCGDVLSGVVSCPADVVLAEDGANQSVTRSVFDHAGNSATASVDGINIDRTNPTISAEVLSTPNTAGWFNGPVTIRFTCGDVLSGVVSCPADVMLAEDGANQSVTRSIFDHAGNSATASVDGINIDRTNPTITASIVNVHDRNTAGWFRSAITVRFTCADTLSGVVECPADVIISDDVVNQSVSGTVFDRAGNSASATIFGINLDQIAPVFPPFADIKVRTTSRGSLVTFLLIATDNGSGVASQKCTPPPGTMFSVGMTVVTCSATDVAGNTSVILFNINVRCVAHIRDRPVYREGGWVDRSLGQSRESSRCASRPYPIYFPRFGDTTLQPDAAHSLPIRRDSTFG